MVLKRPRRPSSVRVFVVGGVIAPPHARCDDGVALHQADSTPRHPPAAEKSQQPGRPGDGRVRQLPHPGRRAPVDRRTRVQRFEELDEDLEYTPSQLDRAVTSRGQIRLILETFRDRLFTEIFPGRSTVPKTLVFCKDDAHAEEVVTLAREVFGKGNDFAAKITYAAKDPKGHLQAFRTSASLRIAVTVDMIATGTDVKPLECVFFLRDVRSAGYFEQMKGRGARTITPADFQAVLVERADFTGANLRGATMRDTYADDAVSDATTTCPDGSHGPCW